jgi:hypothetical protein
MPGLVPATYEHDAANWVFMGRRYEAGDDDKGGTIVLTPAAAE